MFKFKIFYYLVLAINCLFFIRRWNMDKIACMELGMIVCMELEMIAYMELEMLACKEWVKVWLCVFSKWYMDVFVQSDIWLWYMVVFSQSDIWLCAYTIYNLGVCVFKSVNDMIYIIMCMSVC